MSVGMASAETVTLTAGDPGEYTGGFTTTHTANFTDTWTFLPVFSNTSVSASLISIGLNSHAIDFTHVWLNGIELFKENGTVDTAYTLTDLLLTGPITLVVEGISGNNASYSGTINVTVVPEPETIAMLLAGLGLVGVVARRRKNQAQGLGNLAA